MRAAGSARGSMNRAWIRYLARRIWTPPRSRKSTTCRKTAALRRSRPAFSPAVGRRRRARFLRKARELAYRDLGGLVFNLHRFGQRNDALVLAKLTTLGQIDAELRALESALGERRLAHRPARGGHHRVSPLCRDPRQRRQLLPQLRAVVGSPRRPADRRFHRRAGRRPRRAPPRTGPSAPRPRAANARRAGAATPTSTPAPAKPPAAAPAPATSEAAGGSSTSTAIPARTAAVEDEPTEILARRRRTRERREPAPPAGGGIPARRAASARERACPLCGAPLHAAQDWCLRCGAAARTRLAASPELEGRRSRRSRWWRVLSLGVLAAALVKLAGGSGTATPVITRTVIGAAALTPTRRAQRHRASFPAQQAARDLRARRRQSRSGRHRDGRSRDDDPRRRRSRNEHAGRRQNRDELARHAPVQADEEQRRNRPAVKEQLRKFHLGKRCRRPTPGDTRGLAGARYGSANARPSHGRDPRGRRRGGGRRRGRPVRGAVRRARSGAHVVLVSATPLAQTASYWAQGGLAAALAADDSLELHLRDTELAGRGAGAPLGGGDPGHRGARARARPAGARRALRRRSLRAPRARPGGRALGPARRPCRRQRHRPARRSPALRACGRRSRGSACSRAPARRRCGARTSRCRGLVCDDGRVIAARAVVIATGGAAALWARTTNPPGSQGVGLLLAHAAGAALADLEMLQFHPTAVIGVPGREGFLVTEAIRGEGATLLDARGERFVDELAPRDEVSRAIQTAAARSRASHRSAWTCARSTRRTSRTSSRRCARRAWTRRAS